MSLNHECRICVRRLPITEMRQLLPCGHLFCRECTTIWGEISKICPAANCSSPLKLPLDMKWNSCDNPLCLHRLLPTIDLYTLSGCRHELCTFCFQEAAAEERMKCPLPLCGAAIRAEDRDECDGGCKRRVDPQKSVLTICCEARYCAECFGRLFDANHAPPSLESKDQRCPAGRCIQADKREHKNRHRNRCALAPVSPLSLSKCNGYPECEREALRNFPSEMECDHEVCLKCVDRMIGECFVSDSLPMCPNEQCRLPYRFESVVALRALLPERAKYFAGLQLDNTETPPNYVAKNQRFTIRCGISEDEEGPKVITFTRDSTLGELIREIRRVLRILPTDKDV
ncbi:RING-type domain-containing protein [Aphelenchoides fujianensis]|nr:RING-type domain-containing protein [Aphelenchoides fujianensis]